MALDIRRVGGSKLLHRGDRVPDENDGMLVATLGRPTLADFSTPLLLTEKILDFGL